MVTACVDGMSTSRRDGQSYMLQVNRDKIAKDVRTSWVGLLLRIQRRYKYKMRC